MEGIKGHVSKMIRLVSHRERQKNYEVGRIVAKIERLLLWLNDSTEADKKLQVLQGRIPNGK